MSATKDEPLRFEVGDRVECNMGTQWRTGTVIKLRYEDHVLSADGKSLVKESGPYQVRLDGMTDNFIYAKWDGDFCIRCSSVPHKCAECGKGGDICNLQHCGACKMVKYCGVVCQKAHRRTHRAECKRRVDDLRDEVLFKPPPPPEDCPICFLRLPIAPMEISYNPCCGKQVCGGCSFYAQMHNSTGKIKTCPFCREPESMSNAEWFGKLQKRIEKNDARAFHIMGTHYRRGLTEGLPQDKKKAFELWLRGAELGSVESLCSIATAYTSGVGVKVDGVEEDAEKAKHYWELAAIGGHLGARFNLGLTEMNSKQYRRGMRHFMVAAAGGDEMSLQMVREGYQKGDVTKEEYCGTLRAYKESTDEMRSDQRDLFLKESKKTAFDGVTNKCWDDK